MVMRLGDTPVPIPNTMVKTQAADDTMLETAWESRWLPDSYGGVAQLGEHLPCKQGVKSSNLSISIRQSESGGVVLKRMNFENCVLSVACRHAIKSNIETCLGKQAFHTGSNIRFCIRTLKTAY